MEFLDLFVSLLRFASPLILVAMGGLLSERSGIVNIALEGLILFGAYTAAAVTFVYGDPWIGLMTAGIVGLLVGLFYAWLTVGLRSDQIVAGTAINMLAWGGIPFVSKIMFDSTSSTPPLQLDQRLPEWTPMVLAAFAVILIAMVMRKTSFGLWLTFAGEKPAALAAVGVKVKRVRNVAVSLAGLFAGLGGGVLSIALSSSYTNGMSAGRGFMALAALILGKWRTWPAAAACLLFGFCEVLQLKLQGMSLPITGEVPVQLVQIIPYVLTMLLLAGFIGESRAPAALGQ